MLSVQLNVHVLETLAEGPTPLIELRRAVGSPPQTTMRGQLKALTELGVLERRRQDDFPGSVDFELSRSGRELLAVAEVVQGWLGSSPDGPVQLGSVAGKSALKALVEGWSSAIVRALAARPLSLTELSKLITGLSYPSLERRLTAMRLAGQIEPCPGSGRGTPYAVTEWLRRAVGPIAAAVRWERDYSPASVPIGRIDVEAGLLLAVPLLELPADRSGSCRLVVELRQGGEGRLAGTMVTVEQGRIVSCVSRLEGDATAWVAGSAGTWLSALIDRDTDRLELGGDCALAMEILDGLNAALFRVRQTT